MRGYELPILMLLAISASAAGKDKDNGRPPCATTYSVIQEDKLGNVRQGLSNPKNLKWADKDLEKKYPDVCYVPPDPSVRTVFVITVTPATYHGTRVETDTSTTPTSGTVSDTSGQQIGTYEGTQTSTSSTAVPYSFEYGRFMLTVETFGADGKPVVRRRFQQNGIYRTMYGVPLGGRGHHPTKALIEDAVKWIHAGGLEDPLQSVASGKKDTLGVVEESHAPVHQNVSATEETAKAVRTQDDNSQAKAALCDKLPYRLGHIVILNTTDLRDHPRPITKKELKEMGKKQDGVTRECDAFVSRYPGRPMAMDVAWTVEGFAAWYGRCESFCGTEKDRSQLIQKEADEAVASPKK